jgi:para-nitrobenzyl esterase
MIQSGSCPSQTQAQAEATGLSVAGKVGCTDPATALACLRRTSTGRLLDATPASPIVFVRGTSVLPLDPRVAIRQGRFARVPVVVGANRDEGRTFTVGNVGWTMAQYIAWVRSTFGAGADAVLAHYPWPATSDQFTAAYLTGAIYTDSGRVFQIGGCPNRRLTQDFARYTRTYAYEFDHRTGPGLRPEPAGYVWGAGHAAELAYLWPSFNNGTPIAPTFTPAERQLATEMVRYWGAFVRHGRPQVARQPHWPRYDRTRLVLSLRAGGRTTVISDATLAAEHQCGFWDSLPAAAAG